MNADELQWQQWRNRELRGGGGLGTATATAHPQIAQMTQI
jgi:hypothetical protein